jgi:hypothetical protein
VVSNKTLLKFTMVLTTFALHLDYLQTWRLKMTDFEIVMTVIMVALSAYVLWSKFTSRNHKQG